MGKSFRTIFGLQLVCAQYEAVSVARGGFSHQPEASGGAPRHLKKVCSFAPDRRDRIDIALWKQGCCVEGTMLTSYQQVDAATIKQVVLHPTQRLMASK
jgi:hypothetical protein